MAASDPGVEWLAALARRESRSDRFALRASRLQMANVAPEQSSQPFQSRKKRLVLGVSVD
jgi:hypothetical protein